MQFSQCALHMGHVGSLSLSRQRLSHGSIHLRWNAWEHSDCMFIASLCFNFVKRILFRQIPQWSIFNRHHYYYVRTFIYTTNSLKKSRHELIYLQIEYVKYYKISNDCPHLPNTDSLTKVCNVINNYGMTNTTQSYI